jgi:hypothetical protein
MCQHLGRVAPSVRIFGVDGDEIFDPDSWLTHAPPEKGDAQWKDGFSAKEQAKAWLRTGRPAVPEEFWSELAPLADGADELYVRPEHTTRLDRFSRARQHDLFGCARRDGETKLVIGVEAKACENFDGIVADRAAAEAPSKKRARCNLLSRALFGREVLDERSGEILDSGLAAHGYQLWTAAVGTVIEAQRRGVDEVLLVIHQFRPRDPDQRRLGDARNWAAALAANNDAYETFAAALANAGARTHETEFVQAGTELKLAKVESVIDDA